MRGWLTPPLGVRPTGTLNLRDMSAVGLAPGTLQYMGDPAQRATPSCSSRSLYPASWQSRAGPFATPPGPGLTHAWLHGKGLLTQQKRPL